MPDLSDQFEDLATAPAASTTDAGSVTERPIVDLIKADQYLAGKTAVEGTNDQGGPRSLWSKLRPAQAIPRDPI